MKKASEVLNKQTSFSQWYIEASPQNGKIFKKEDEEKNQRLKILHEKIRLPINIGLDMPLTELLNLNSDSNLFIAGVPISEATMGIRLVPFNDADTMYRTRGKRLTEIITWVASLEINPKDYTANVLPHVEVPDFSTIFIVSENGIKGEAIKGPPHLLTQGFYDDLKPVTFRYDFENLHIISDDNATAKYLNEIISSLQITDEQFTELCSTMSGLEMVKGYLSGYFETVTSKQYGLWFIDFNRFLGSKLDNILVDTNVTNLISPTLKGIPVSQGLATGKLVIVTDETLESGEFKAGDILACKMTTPAYIPLMKIAGAILTQQGGILSHAAIISRELGKPCIAAITELFNIDIGEKYVSVDANSGTINVLEIK